MSDEAGVYVAKSTDSSNFFVFGHPEYDRDTLLREYERDVAGGMAMALPATTIRATTRRASPWPRGFPTRSCCTRTG